MNLCECINLTEQKRILYPWTLWFPESYQMVKMFFVKFLLSMHRIVRHSHRRNILYSLLDYFDCRLRQKSMVLNWLQRRNARAMAKQMMMMAMMMVMMIRAIPHAHIDIDASEHRGEKQKHRKKVKLEKVAYAKVYDIYYWNPK